MKKSILVLVLGVVLSASLFAQMPEKHTITVDVGPTIIGVAVGATLGAVGEGLNGSGFGIAGQYEFQPWQRFSVAARFAYLGITASYDPVTMDMKSYSIEGHGRFYPFGGAFFLDGMLGFANFNLSGSGSAEGVSANIGTNMNYFKLGAKLGWRIDFGRPGGFVFEPAFGYSAGIGDKSNISVSAGGIPQEYQDMANDMANSAVGGSGLDDMIDTVADYIFVGGPRMTLAFGWRF
ncbi:MAG: autotransporter domain-containing protein [Treponema sp.]|jgi:hypothetical protein|nr:autotransporter domain-containing protein [Treponema sp.]